MSGPKTIKRLVACFGSIQLVTALSVLSYRESQQSLNFKYDNYLVITPLWAPEEHNKEFAAFIEKMAKSIYLWERIVYVPLEQMKSIANKLNLFGFSETSNLVQELLGSESFDEVYLSRSWELENQLLMNVYKSAEKICYGDGCGIYFSQSAFPVIVPVKNSYVYFLKSMYTLLKEKIKIIFPSYQSLKGKIKAIFPQQKFLKQEDFDAGYFFLPYAFSEVPPMETIVLDKAIFLKTIQKARETFVSSAYLNYIGKLRSILQNVSTSILLTSNFSEASSRMSLENEIAAYREFLYLQGISKESILLIKPHPRDSEFKIHSLKSVLNDLYSDIFLLEDILFYLPFEIFFMDVFFNEETMKFQSPRIFAFSSACLTLEFFFDVQCTVGFGSSIVRKYFYKAHVSSRLKHEAVLSSAIREIRYLNKIT